MVGGISMVGSSVMDSHSSPCLCVDSMTSKTHLSHTKSEGKKHLFRPGSLELRSSFVHSNYYAKTPCSKKQRKGKGLVVVNELGGQYEDSFRDVQAEKHELAERVMVTRLHLYGKWIKKVDHAEMYKDLSDQNLELMRERLMETVIWPSDDANWDNYG
ncbi:chaperonin-like RbcX protein 2, chloroplastic [Tanacetum coccineum]